MRLTRLAFFGLISCMPGLLLAQTSDATPRAPLFDNLGHYHHAITTSEPLAQQFFDQGMVLYYGFEWSESIRSFKEATRLDPQCAMCYWGLALSLAYKTNAPMTGKEFQDGTIAIKKAMELAKNASPIEQDYIQSLSHFYQHPTTSPTMASGFSCHHQNQDNDEGMKDYLGALNKISMKYPNDHDLKDLFAAATFWYIANHTEMNKSTNPKVIAAINAVKSVLAEDKSDIGANHYYIHLIEGFDHPEEAMASADRFKTLVPGSEHLVHMPAHIYFLTGHYHDASEANQNAINAFDDYHKICREQGFEPEMNYLYFHNYDFLRSSAAMEGRKKLAIATARQLVDQPFSSWLDQEASLQWFIPIPYFVKARFGVWDELLDEPMPNAKYQYAVGMWNYSHGMALAHTGDVKHAEKNEAELQKIIQKGPAENSLGKNGQSLLKIAYEILSATLADQRHDEKSEIEHLKSAVKLQQAMHYHEPPDWYFPVKEALAEAEMEWNHPKDAIPFFKEDLKQYPQNGWALYGLMLAQRQAGNQQDALKTENEFKLAWHAADIPEPVLLFPITHQHE